MLSRGQSSRVRAVQSTLAAMPDDVHRNSDGPKATLNILNSLDRVPQLHENELLFLFRTRTLISMEAVNGEVVAATDGAVKMTMMRQIQMQTLTARGDEHGNGNGLRSTLIQSPMIWRF